jgi:glutathione synthase
MPPPGGFVSNLAKGGTAVIKPLSARQEKVIGELGNFLKLVGVFFAGADLIGDKVSEVNITSPTGILAFKKLTGQDLAPLFWEKFEAQL